jgi:glycosyltransferase involved in cell wall biosynthesis
MKTLIITYYWPPAGGSGVQRWLKFVKYFRNFGIEPIVYTADNANYAIEDNTLINEVPANIEVLKLPIWEPNTILSIFGQNKKESAGFLNPNPSFLGKILQFSRANFFVPDARKFWIKPSIKYLEKFISENNIQTIITTGPPHSMHLIGLGLKKKLNIKWVADFRDPWTEIDYFHQLPLTKWARKKHFKQERLVLKNADTVVVVGDTMKTNYEKISKNIVTITNGYDTFRTEESFKLDEKFSLTHIGLMNSDRNPAILWEVLSDICKGNELFKNDLLIKLVGSVDDSVKQLITKYNLYNNVNYISYLPHNEVLKFQKNSQILLLAVNNVPSAKGIITGKIFEYLNAKRPILAIAPLDGDLAKIIHNTNAGFVVGFNNRALLKKNILDLYELYKKGSLKVNSNNIDQYHRKELTKKMSELIFSLAK